MNEEWLWWWGEGTEPERYNGGQPTREAAIADAEASFRDTETVTICEGKPWALHDDFLDADTVLELWHEHNEEAQDEDGELAMAPTDEQRRELEAVLTAAFAAWRQKHSLGRAWALHTRNEEVMTLPVKANA